jgi:hypothetical protein
MYLFCEIKSLRDGEPLHVTAYSRTYAYLRTYERHAPKEEIGRRQRAQGTRQKAEGRRRDLLLLSGVGGIGSWQVAAALIRAAACAFIRAVLRKAVSALLTCFF